MSIVTRLWLVTLITVSIAGAMLFMLSKESEARNIIQYSDTISDSAPDERANHTFEFILNTGVSGGARFEVTPPQGFSVLSTTTFDIRNVELLVNGVARTAGAVASVGIDQVEIFPGSPGFFRYTLAPDAVISSGAQLELRIGNHTSGSIGPFVSFSSTTGTTTYAGDIEPIVNASALGIHRVQMEVWEADLVADASFVIFLNQKVVMPGVDTTEEIPPFRFNPTPTSTVGGTTQSVEISLETDELAICRFSTASSTPFGSMTNTFSNTGLIFHSTIVSVTPNSLQRFFVRCIDDEGNFNIDDFLIQFRVDETPAGQSNTDGSTSGNGTGTGNSGTGTGNGGGGTSGSANGGAPTTGGSSGSGGSGGGGGGGRGDTTGGTAGGGFETDDAPYRSGDARVIISGFAFPNSNVAVMVDGKVAQTTRAGSNASYTITLDAISRGVYTFGVYAEGSDKIRSATFSTSFTVTGARTSELTNINVSPSIKVTPDPVNPGETLTVTGSALPNSVVTVQNGKAKSKMMSESTAQADGSGRWSLTLNTSNFSKGTYQIRAKSAQANGATTNYSAYTFYGVGEQAATGVLNADLNRDGRVNLTDFSILLFWWNSNGGDSDPPADINRDGRVTLTDFSILLFNWSG